MKSGVLTISLWLALAFNLFAAAVLAFPESAPGQLAALPVDVPVLYRVLAAWLVALFGLAYGWLALQSQLDRSLLAFGAIGKGSVFVLALGMWLSAAVPSQTVVLAAGDLAFAAFWFWFLLQSRQDGAA